MFKILDKVCKPTNDNEYSVYIDVYARKDITIRAGETTIVPLGVCVDLTKIKNNIAQSLGYEQWFDGNSERTRHLKYRLNEFLKSHYLQLTIRNSLAVRGLIFGNGVGIITLDCTDEIQMIIHNSYTETIYKINEHIFKIKKDDKIAQIILLEYKSYLMNIENNNERNGE